MNFVNMNANQSYDEDVSLQIVAEAETKGILDDDTGVILYGEHAGYKVRLMGKIPNPVMIQSGDVVDALDETLISFGIAVVDPDGNTTLYAPDVKTSQAIWKKQS